MIEKGKPAQLTRQTTTTELGKNQMSTTEMTWRTRYAPNKEVESEALKRTAPEVRRSSRGPILHSLFPDGGLPNHSPLAYQGMDYALVHRANPLVIADVVPHSMVLNFRPWSDPIRLLHTFETPLQTGMLKGVSHQRLHVLIILGVTCDNCVDRSITVTCRYLGS